MDIHTGRQVSGYCFVSEWIMQIIRFFRCFFYKICYVCRILFTYNIDNNNVAYTVIIDIVYLIMDTVYILIHVRCSIHITSVFSFQQRVRRIHFPVQFPKMHEMQIFPKYHFNVSSYTYFVLHCIFIFFCCFVL